MNDPARLKLDRVGSSLGMGGDFDVSLRFARLNRDAAYSERLLIYHWIPKIRMRLRYLMRLCFYIGRDWIILKRFLRREKSPFGAYTGRGILLEMLYATRDWIFGRYGIQALSSVEMTVQAFYMAGQKTCFETCLAEERIGES